MFLPNFSEEERIKENVVKKISLILLVGIILLAGLIIFNSSIIDSQSNIQDSDVISDNVYAIIKLPSGEIVEGNLESSSRSAWDQMIKLEINDKFYEVHTVNVVLIESKN